MEAEKANLRHFEHFCGKPHSTDACSSSFEKSEVTQFNHAIHEMRQLCAWVVRNCPHLYL